MQLSRELRRSIKNSGVAKKLENTFYKTISEIKRGIEPMDSLKLVSDDKTYDITPIVLLGLSLIGAKNTEKGFDLVHKHICEHIKNRDYSDERTKIYLVGSNLSTILDKYVEAGLHDDIERTLNIGRLCGVYKGSIGGYLIDAYYDDEVNEVFSIVDESKRFEDMYLSTVYGVALDTYSLCMLDNKSITDEFLALYMLVLTLSDDSDIYKFLKTCMTYCISNNLKEGVEFDFIKNISGNVLDDLEKIDIKYANALKSLECSIEKQSYVNDCDSLTDAEFDALELFRVLRISATLDYMYKFFIVEHSKNLRDLKNDGIVKQKELLRENRSLNKKLLKVESNLKSKTKEVDKLNKALRLSKKNTSDDSDKKRIAELEAKLKVVESKNVALTNRISTLEDRLKNVQVVKPKATIIEEEVACTVETVCELPTLSMEDKLESIKDTRLLVLGGNSNWFSRLKEYIPNSVHIDVNQKGSNYSVPLSTECVLVVSNMVTHSHVFRLETQLRKGVPIVTTPTYRLSDIVDYLYRDLVEKSELKKVN